MTALISVIPILLLIVLMMGFKVLRHHALVCHRGIPEGMFPHHPYYYLCNLQLQYSL